MIKRIAVPLFLLLYFVSFSSYGQDTTSTSEDQSANQQEDRENDRDQRRQRGVQNEGDNGRIGRGDGGDSRRARAQDNDGANDGRRRRGLRDVPVPEENPITESKRVLGKILFWEEQLSSDNTIACGTCHQPAAGGSDSRQSINPGFDLLFGSDDDTIGSPGIHALDENGDPVDHPVFGFEPQVTPRASPSFLTAMFSNRLFWDGRASGEFVDPLDPDTVIIENSGALESQSVSPILNSTEMAQAGRSWQDVIEKLQSVEPLALASNIPPDMSDALQGSDYPSMFEAAFGDPEITPVRIAMAIATYERTLLPDQTPWDRFIAGDDSAMTTDQIAGWRLFNEETPCRNCHRPPLFTDNRFRNIGLRPSFEDLGEFEVTGRNGDRGDFKTPSLRNVGLRESLMHVGWIIDVEDAIDFYNAGTNDTGHVQFTEDQSGIPGRNNGTINEINVFGDDPVSRGQIIDFLSNGLTDPRVATESYPFDRPQLGSEAD